MARRHAAGLLVAALLGLILISSLLSGHRLFSLISGGSLPQPHPARPSPSDLSNTDDATIRLPSSLLTGGAIAPKLENATTKAELGRASWKLLHTMMARFPEKPTADDSAALSAFIHLFARLYPCGECAAHFQTLLRKFPPQTSGRNAAVGWACHVHNQVNHRLKKQEFDCSKIGDFYDCGCGEDEAATRGEGSDPPIVAPGKVALDLELNRS